MSASSRAAPTSASYRGARRRRRAVVGLIKSLSVLRSKFGKVHVNLGQPIDLDELLQRHNPHWRERASPEDSESPSGWIGEAIADLAFRIVCGINAAAAVTPVNLVAMAVLATPRQALLEADLVRQLELYQRLLRDAPYTPLVTVPADGGERMTRYAESMGMLERQPHPLGDIMRMSDESRRARDLLSQQYSASVRHAVAPGLLLHQQCAHAHGGHSASGVAGLSVHSGRVVRCAGRRRRSAPSAESLLDAFVRSKLLQVNADRSEWQRPEPTSLEAIQLSLLAEATIQTIERYYLVIALLLQAGSGNIGQEALEERCHLMAQRMSLLYGLNSPEFFDKSLFRNFIDLLEPPPRGRTPAEDGTLKFGEPLLGVATDAQLVLSEQIRHDILQVTLGQ